MTATISADRVRAVLRVAWLAVALGIAVQIVVFAVRIAAGLKVPAAMLMADLTQGTTWGVIVCVGVAIGVTAERSRALLGGLLGAISGPIGWGIAKSAQRAVQELLGVAVDQFTPFFFLLVAVKGAEYLLLGWAVGRLGEREEARAGDYALPGIVIGVLSATIVVALNLWHAPMPAAKLVGVAVGELIFPIGCALVIYAPVHMRRFAGLA
jgi:hypothetical protein